MPAASIPKEVLDAFGVYPARRVRRLKGGYLHLTFLVETEKGSSPLVLQRISPVFYERIDGLLSNYLAIYRALSAGRPSFLGVPQPLATKKGAFITGDEEGLFWRAFSYVPSVSIKRFGAKRRAGIAGRAFGAYVAGLAQMGVKDLVKTLPGFHDLEHYFGRFKASLESAEKRRLSRAGELVEKVFEDTLRPFSCPELKAAPRRIVHNDAKAENLLVLSGRPLSCFVIDLDTTFEGHLWADFGDLVRSCCTGIREEGAERRPPFDWEAFCELLSSYLSALEGLQRAELDSLALGATAIAWEISVRFLTDFLEGDVYFRISRPEQNLERAMRMWKLYEVLKAAFERMQKEIEAVAKSFD